MDDGIFRPLTPEEAQAAYDAAEPEPLSEERIKEIVEYATGKTRLLPSERKYARLLDEIMRGDDERAS